VIVSRRHFQDGKRAINRQREFSITCTGSSDAVETETSLKLRDRDFIKNSWTRDLKFETETRGFKICGFCRSLSKKRCDHFKLSFFRISDIFLTCFDCFLPANTAGKKLVELQKYSKAMSLQSSKFQDNRFVTETCNLRDRVSKNGSRDSITNWKFIENSLALKPHHLEFPAIAININPFTFFFYAQFQPSSSIRSENGTADS